MSTSQEPKLDPDLTREQALHMILSSIAMEELALSKILTAESAKLTHVLKQNEQFGCCCTSDILAVNKSVTDLLEMVMQNQMILKNKMDKVLTALPDPTPDPACCPKPSSGCRPHSCSRCCPHPCTASSCNPRPHCRKENNYR